MGNAGVSDLLLDTVTGVTLRSLNILCLSLSFARFALDPNLIGEANRFPRVMLGVLLTSPSGKCLEQTRVLGFISASLKSNTCSQRILFFEYFGILWKETVGSLALVFPQTQHL